MASRSQRLLVLLVAGLLAQVPAGPGAAAGGPAWVDPTRPPASFRRPAPSEAASGPGLELDSILIGDGRRLALIGGRAYRVGDRVGALTVQNIYRDRVVLRGPDGTRILRLTMSSAMKKAPSP